MNRVFGLLLPAALLLASCSKKTHPVASKAPVYKPRTTTAPVVVDAPPSVPTPTTETPPVTTTTAVLVPMIVIDEKGSVITSRDKLPAEIAGKVDYSKISRGYTPVQRQNLITRYKLVPPRVLFVPDQLASKSGRGTYIIYRKKFWYWKKEDGLFHIDETYYQ